MDQTGSCDSLPGMPRIGEHAPFFEAVTTQGDLRLDDYAGSWLVLFSHPADFTPVCTTEFLAFMRLYPLFKDNGCELLGLSTDSLYSHIAWVRNVESVFGVKIEFPIISDATREVSYPMTTGRSVDEILRQVQALRITDKHGVATPAGWLPGDKVIVAPPRTQEMADERVKAGEPDCQDWYFCLRNPG